MSSPAGNPHTEARVATDESRAPGAGSREGPGSGDGESEGAPSPGYGVRIDRLPGRVRAELDGSVLAESERALLVTETGHPPTVYFPPEDVRVDLLEPSGHRTYCPFRGTATHWHVRAPSGRIENGAWSYEDPWYAARQLRGHIAFYESGHRRPGGLDSGIRIRRGAGGAPAATLSPARGHPNPLLAWLLHEAPLARTIRELLEGFATRALASGIPLWRMTLTLRTLHPQLYSTTYTWVRDTPLPESEADGGAGGGRGEAERPGGQPGGSPPAGEARAPEDAAPGPGPESGRVAKRSVGYDILGEARYLDSPLKAIFEGAGGVRCRLEGPSPDLRYPIVRELHQEGVTDYVAMPLVFSDGQINALSIATRRPGGFQVAELGHIDEILLALARIIEVHAARERAVTLLETYLGRHSGECVLNGLVRRGDGEELRAVILYADLRDSTPLARELPRPRFLSLLNAFFEGALAAVPREGGEILRFIGDAALAIFPVEGGARCARPWPARSPADACANALRAVRAGRERLLALNEERHRAGEEPIRYGMALHLGEVTYGNIGTPDRLEFTVVGSDANEAARLEGLTRTLGRNVVLSESFVQALPGPWVPLGRHVFRGVPGRHQVFGLPEEGTG